MKLCKDCTHFKESETGVEEFSKCKRRVTISRTTGIKYVKEWK